MWRGICGNDKCLPLWESNNATHQTSWGMCKNLTHGCKPTVLVSDYNTLVVNSTGAAKRATDFSGCKRRCHGLMRAVVAVSVVAVSLPRKTTLGFKEGQSGCDITLLGASTCTDKVVL